MRARAVSRSEATAEGLGGKILLRDVPVAGGAVRKGRPLTPEDVDRLLGGDWATLHLAELEAGDVHEEPAGERIARAIGGAGTVVGRFSGGYWPVTAHSRGLLEIAADRLAGVNHVDGVAVCTLLDGQVVDDGELLARVKVVPYALPEASVSAAEDAAGSGAVSVRRFPPRSVGAVAVESLSDAAAARFEESLTEKLSWLGSRLAPVQYIEDDPGAVADALRTLIEDGVDLILAAGSKAMDPLDATLQALASSGGALERRGAPVFPGTLVWLADLKGVPVLGLPSCGLFSGATVVDLLLPRLLAGEVPDFEGLGALGHGGLLSAESAYRLPRYGRDGGRGAL